MRHVIGVFGVAASIVLLGVSAAMNWRFGYNLGKTEFDSLIFGFASAASDGLKALLPFLVVAAWRQRHLMQAAGGSLLMAICVVYSLSSALGFAALNRADTAGTRALASTQYADSRAELARLREKRTQLPQHRPAGTVSAEIAAAQQHYRWTTTAGCTDVTAAESRELCSSYHRLRGELAVAEEDALLTASETKLATSIEGVTGASASQAVDPQVELFAAILGVPVHGIQTGMHLLIAALVELGSSLGIFVSFAYWKVTEPRRGATMPPPLVMAAAAPPQPTFAASPRGAAEPLHAALPAPEDYTPVEQNDDAAEPPPTDIELFLRERVRVEDGASVTAMLLADEYRRWCEATGRPALTPPSFNRQLGDYGLPKSKIAGKLRYLGIAINEAASSVAPVRSALPALH